jgi:hypothetical protein
VKRARSTPLWIALAMSVLAHAVTLGGGWLIPPVDAPPPPPLLAHLQTLPPQPAPPPAPKPRPVVKATPRPQPAKPPAPRAAPKVALAPAVSRSDAPSVWATSIMPALDDEPLIAPMADETVPAQFTEEGPPRPEPVVVATAAPTTSTFLPEPDDVRTLPRRGRIEYQFNIYWNGMSTDIARTVQTWEASGRTYRIDSKSDTVGLARFAPIGPHEYQSVGTVTEHGLQPQYYTSKEERRGNLNASSARFDWDAKHLQYGRPNEKKDAPLVPGTQDFVSFMFQLSLAPPAPGRITLPITNGRNVETYELDVLPEERMDSPMGLLRVLPIRRVTQPGEDGITVYLATEYRYLPVRIVHTNRDGTPGGEVVATSIQVE